MYCIHIQYTLMHVLYMTICEHADMFVCQSICISMYVCMNIHKCIHLQYTYIVYTYVCSVHDDMYTC